MANSVRLTQQTVDHRESGEGSSRSVAAFDSIPATLCATLMAGPPGGGRRPDRGPALRVARGHFGWKVLLMSYGRGGATTWEVAHLARQEVFWADHGRQFDEDRLGWSAIEGAGALGLAGGTASGKPE